MVYESRRGFTLIEFSIVFVIIGLLAGSVVVGQKLIRSSELRTLITDRDKYIVALGAFQEKFNALPGDMSNAVKYWGADAGATTDGVDTTCADLQSGTPKTATCNGNGDGFIADSSAQMYESYRAWQQLANAGVIGGSYAGNSITGGRTGLVASPGINAPKSSVALGASWSWRSQVVAGTITDSFTLPSSNLLFVGNTTITGEGTGPVMTPQEAWNVDTKLDDGKPALGSVKSFKGTGTINPGCTVDATDNTDYKLSNGDVACSFIFILNVKG